MTHIVRALTRCHTQERRTSESEFVSSVWTSISKSVAHVSLVSYAELQTRSVGRSPSPRLIHYSCSRRPRRGRQPPHPIPSVLPSPRRQQRQRRQPRPRQRSPSGIVRSSSAPQAPPLPPQRRRPHPSTTFSPQASASSGTLTHSSWRCARPRLISIGDGRK